MLFATLTPLKPYSANLPGHSWLSKMLAKKCFENEKCGRRSRDSVYFPVVCHNAFSRERQVSNMLQSACMVY